MNRHASSTLGLNFKLPAGSNGRSYDESQDKWIEVDGSRGPVPPCWWGLPHTTRADADRPLNVYFARLSNRDHVNSNGQGLTTVAAIIRQDRANYHKFGRRDGEDEDDAVFGDAHNRELLESKLAAGHCGDDVRREILNGTPLIFVKIYPDSVDVTVLD